MRILSVEISAIVHATEDSTKVAQALRNVLSEHVSDEVKMTMQYLQGHHGNPIRTLRTGLKKRKIIDQFLNHLMTNLNADDLKDMAKNVNMYMDEEGNMYLRLDKQAAYRGEIRSKQEDPIRVKMKVIDELGMRKPSIESVKELIESYEKVR